MREQSAPSPATAGVVVALEDLFSELVREKLGSKEKFWLDLEIGGTSGQWLFKQSKMYKETGQVSGEHWSEHLTSRLMRLAGVPAHVTRLAKDHDGAWGVLCRNVLHGGSETLLHGVELLIQRASAKGKHYRADMNYPKGYDVARVFRTLWDECGEAGALHFADIILMDAWFRNSDRHDENWGVILTADGGVRPCPAYDNASSLGRSLTPHHMLDYLEGRRHGMAGFMDKGQSAFPNPEGGKRLRPEEALARLVAECDCRTALQRRLDIIEEMDQRIGQEVDAVLGAAGCGETETRFVRTLLDESLHRISSCIQ